jgi:hypothetical protein
MPTVPLPTDASLVQLRKQAKELRDATGSTLAEAQLSLARRHGFASWPRLVETALHRAVHRDAPAVVELLLDLGADPTIEDLRFRATPLGWAQHFGNAALIQVLEAATPPGDGAGSDPGPDG